MDGVLAEIEERHVLHNYQDEQAGECDGCADRWPCDAIKAVRAVRAQSECMNEHASNCSEFDPDDYSDYILAALRGESDASSR